MEIIKLLDEWIGRASDFMWGPAMLVLLFGTHLFLTIRLRFMQRYIGKAIRLSFSRKHEGAGDVTHFGALMTALAATIGTGNIVGVATAVAAGGPGAVLWMWLTGVFGIATKYSEAVLAVKYRIVTPGGQMAGGPMYALERGLHARWLGIIFAAFTAVAAFGIGNMTQANAISELVHDTVLRLDPHHWSMALWMGVSLDKWITGVLIMGFTAMVILGGIKSIASVCEKLVPFMAIFYVLGCLVLLAMRYETLGSTLALICKTAFTGQAAVGGFMGAGISQAMRWGVARGLFSNESGLGSAPIVAAAAQTTNPVRQALVSSTGTFWDTVVVCAMTGLVLVNGQQWLAEGAKGGAALTNASFNAFPVIGPIILVGGLLTFVFSTILGWSYYGEKAIEYLFGTRAILPYRLLWVVAVLVGSVKTLKSIWAFADLANACMAIPNLISLLLLSGVIVAETRKYLWNPDQSEEEGPASEEKASGKGLT